MAWFNKYYQCSLGHKWEDEWDCLCEDRCPVCDEPCSPYDYAEIDEGGPKEKESTHEGNRKHLSTSGERSDNSD